MFARRILLLSIVLLILVATVFYLEMPSSSTGERDEIAGSERIFSAYRIKDLKQVTRLEPGPKFAILRESDGAWEVVDKRFVVLDPRALRRFFDGIFSLTSSNSIELSELQTSEGGLVEHVGLTPPQGVVELEWENGKKDHLEFGLKNPVSGRRYLRLNQESRVRLVEDYFANQLLSSLSDIRLSTPFAIAIDEVTQVEVKSAAATDYFRTYAINAGEGAARGSWTIKTADGDWIGDSEFIRRKLNELSLAHAEAFIDPPDQRLSEIRSKPPLLQFEFKFKAIDTPVIFALWEETEPMGEPKGGKFIRESDLTERKVVYAERRGWPTVFRLSRRPHLDFLHGPTNFRNRKPFSSLDISRVISVCMEQHELDAVKQIGFNRRRSPDGTEYFERHNSCGQSSRPGSAIPISAINESLENLRAVPVLTHLDRRTEAKRNHGASQYRLTVRLHSRGASEDSASGAEQFELNVLEPVGEVADEESASKADSQLDTSEDVKPRFAEFSSPAEKFVAVISGGEAKAVLEQWRGLRSE